MIFVLLVLVVVFLVVSESKGSQPKKERRIVAYNTQTGNPIYLDQCRLIGYNTDNGNPIFENPYKIAKYDIHTGAPIYATIEIAKEEINDEIELSNQNAPSVKAVKKPLTAEEKKDISNSILMIVGALLVVIASVIFLVSSWDTIPGLFKTLVLVLVQMMFFGFGYVCKNKLSIPKVAKVFNYLALCFLPIVLVSLSTFELVGEYLSIEGEGYALFFALSFILTDVAYKSIGYLKKDNVCKIMSLASEILAIIFIGIFFDISFELLLFVLSIYNVFVYILLQGNYLDQKAYLIPNRIINYVLLALLCITMFNSDNLILYIAMIIYAVYYYVMYVIAKDEKMKRNHFAFFIFTYIISLTVANRIDVCSYFIYLLGLIPLVLVTKVMKDESNKPLLYNVEAIMGALFILDSFKFVDKTLFYLMTFIAGLLLYLVLYIVTKKPLFKSASYVLFTAIFIDIFYIADFFEYAKYIPLVVVVLVYSLEAIFDNLKDKYSNNLILLTLTLESVLLIRTYFVFIPLLLMLIYVKLEKVEEGWLIIPMIMGISLFDIESNLTTIILSYILISIYTIISLLHKKFSAYSFASLVAIIMAGITFNYNDIIFFAILLLWGIVHIIRNYKEKNYIFKLVTIISILGLYNSTLDYFDISFNSLYAIGYYIAFMATTKLIIKNVDKSNINFIECFGFALISIICLFSITEVEDALIIMAFLFVTSLVSFVKQWRTYLYMALIVMVINIIYLTAEFWAQIPWYFYILVIGMGLIVFAMFNEKFKQRKTENKKQDEVIKEVQEIPVKEQEVVEDDRKEKVEVEKIVPKKRGRKKKSETLTKSE